jgi:glycosyltransferase involved in cell wall biosynthesis
LQNISIVIPLAKDETKYKTLARQLEDIYYKNFEIIFVGCCDKHYYHLSQKIKKFVYLKTTESRAKQLNFGASKANGKFIWFLHADSRINKSVILALETASKKHSNSLSYFRLKFYDKPHPFIALNEWGAWIRSHLLKIPFGDQGFFLKKSIFNKLDGFCEQCSYGEDHLFIWKAHQQNIPLKGFKNKLYTSARKYQQHGWSKLTTTYQYLWIKQAFPQWIKKCRTAQK